MQRTLRAAMTLGVVALLLALTPLVASAHEQRELADGQYEMVVGFIDEPAFVREKNGLWFSVTKPSAATPVAEGEEGEAEGVLGLADTLQAEVIFGEETMELELRPSFSEPGVYTGYFFPMAEGDYTFHIFGTIESTEIDERFTSSPEGFDGVQPREPLEFPKEESSSTGGVAATLGDTGGSGRPGSPLAVAGIGAALALAVVAGRRLARRPATAPARA